MVPEVTAPISRNRAQRAGRAQQARRRIMWRAAGIVGGVLADRLIADPSTHHPVAWFGTSAQRLESIIYRPHRPAGVAHLLLSVAPPVAATCLIDRALCPRAEDSGRHALARGTAEAAFLATCLWAAVGAHTLERTGLRMHAALSAGDDASARELVPWLCSRDPNLLDAAGMARATVESLAENTSDATIAPIVWAAIAGAPGVVLHRCVNTLDAMVGYRNGRYQNFGWAAARTDDMLAWIPARLTAVYHVLCADRWGRADAALRAWRTQAAAHPSPNAGPVESTAAGALGVTLGGPTAYAHGVEHRPVLGEGPAPDTDTIIDAVRLARWTEILAVVDAIGDALVAAVVVSWLGRKNLWRETPEV